MARDLYIIAKECMDELEAIGIQYGKIMNFEINYRAKKRWGQCRYKNGWYTINISACLLENSVPIESLKDTIIHEILHTCEGCMNHGNNWKIQAEKVNRAYGYNIKRCTSAEEKGIDVEQTEKYIKHKFICEDCGQVITRQRDSKFTKYYKHYTCGRCGGKFNKVF